MPPVGTRVVAHVPATDVDFEYEYYTVTRHLSSGELQIEDGRVLYRKDASQEEPVGEHWGYAGGWP
jgi:hypothetical protein